MDGRFKYKIIKRVGENLQGLGLGEEFLDITPEAGSRKQKSLN